MFFELVPAVFSDLICTHIIKIIIQTGKKLGFRNLQEKLENRFISDSIIRSQIVDWQLARGQKKVLTRRAAFSSSK